MLERPHDAFKRQLLTGEITAEDLHRKLLELDQSTSDRKHALDNYNLLSDAEVENFIQTQTAETQAAFYGFLGFTEFHLGQIKVVEGSESEALHFFTEALKHAERAKDHEDWVTYITATVAYFEGDIVKLQQAAQNPALTGNNREIVSNLLRGLQQRGRPSYLEDYRID